MPLSRTRDYLSIGEVLETVRPEFPDVTISKIRFLEAEGLITPERTASGYRKFFDSDVERLRFILALQKEQFLPLKVIRQRLAQAETNGGALKAPSGGGVTAEPVDQPIPTGDLTAMQITRAELVAAARLSEEEMAALEEFSVITKRPTDVYDEGDLMIAKAARRFFAFGVEPRHLKMYRQFAEREAAFFEQIVGPGARRRDPQAKDEAAQSLGELMALSRQLREATLRHSLRELL